MQTACAACLLYLIPAACQASSGDGGSANHVHLLIVLPPTACVGTAIQKVEGLGEFIAVAGQGLRLAGGMRRV